MADAQADIRSDNLKPVRGYTSQDETRHKPEGRTFTFEELKLIWGAAGEEERRRETRRMLDIYNHEWLDQLNELIKSLHLKQNHEKLLQKADISINVLRSVAKELGGIYDFPATRSVEVDGEETTDGLDPYLAEGALDDCLAELGPLGWVTRELFIRPLVRYDGMVVLDVMTPDKVSFVQNEIDPTMMDAIIIDLGQVDTGSSTEQRYEAWTTESYAILDAGFEPVVEEGEDPKHTNHLGLIPWVKFNAVYPAIGKWHLSDSFGVRDATLSIGAQKVNYNHVKHLQSHKQLIATSNASDTDEIKTKLKLLIDPASCVHWRDGEIKAIDLQADITAQLQTLIDTIDMVLQQEGINADVARGKQTASSGYQLVVSMHKQRKVWAKYQRSWSRCERALYQVAQVVHAHQCDAMGIDCDPLPEGKLVVSFGDLGPEANPLEQATLAKALQDVGWSEENTMREVFGKSEDWIKANAAEKRKKQEQAFGNQQSNPFAVDPVAAADDDQADDQEDGEEVMQ